VIPNSGQVVALLGVSIVVVAVLLWSHDTYPSFFISLRHASIQCGFDGDHHRPGH